MVIQVGEVGQEFVPVRSLFSGNLALKLHVAGSKHP